MVNVIVVFIMILLSCMCCVQCNIDMYSFEIKTEDDDITEYPDSDKPNSGKN